MIARTASNIANAIIPQRTLSILRKRKDTDNASEDTKIQPGDLRSRNGSFVFFGRRHSAFEDAGLFRLSASELAFLSLEVRLRLGRTVGHMPPAPSVFKSRGTVLFVDVSGFTRLGLELRDLHGHQRGAELLAEEITIVLALLTKICLDHGGDVSKFAGDALLCVFDSGNKSHDEELMNSRAKQCALAMLVAMNDNPKLDIHGGLCPGSILHFHLGSADDRMRWYIMGGEAMAIAASLVDAASPGEILCAEDEGMSKPGHNSLQQTKYRHTAESEALDASPHSNLPRRPTLLSPRPSLSKGMSANWTFTSPNANRKGTNKSFFTTNSGENTALLTERNELFQLRAQSDLREVRGNTTTSRHESSELKISILDSQSSLPNNQPQVKKENQEDPVLRAGLPRSCNVYIPAALRIKGAMEDVVPEMKTGVSIVFVDVEGMMLTEDEYLRESISDQKLDQLNDSFVKMTRITHAFGGEVRDMLFDDKGCVFIAVFGAHHSDSFHPHRHDSVLPTTGTALKSTKSRANLLASVAAMMESSEMRAAKAGIAITTVVPTSRVGVSSGSCFVGMCGTEKRHDFIVIGHEVNMAARLMVLAKRGQVICSPEVREVCLDVLHFEEVQVQMQKRNVGQVSTAFLCGMDIAKQESFLAQFRYDLFDSDLFVGRSEELASVERILDQMCLSNKTTESSSGCVVIEAPLGIGKSAFVSRVRKMGKGRISICHARCRDSFVFAPWRSILESLTGLRADMKVEEIKDILRNFDNAHHRVDLASLAKILPFIGEVFDLEETVVMEEEEEVMVTGEDWFGEAFSQTVAKVAKCLSSLLVLGNASSRRAGAKGTLVILENLEKIDLPSLLVLEYLIDHLSATKRLAFCLTVLTKRPVPPSTEPQSFEEKLLDRIYAVVEKASKTRNKLRLNLKGLKEEDVNQLLTRCLGHPADNFVLSALYTITKGCPMHFTNVLQYCRERGLISRTNDGADDTYHWVISEEKVKELIESPDLATVESVICVRFEKGLDKDTKDLLRIAANINGSEFDAIFLSQSFSQVFQRQMDERVILDKLREARKAGFIVVYVEDKSCPESEHAWGFKHDTVAEVVMRTVSKETVQVWEPLIAEAYRALELRLQLGFFGRVDDFDMV